MATQNIEIQHPETSQPGAPPKDISNAGVAGTERLLSLDIFRGFTMQWIVGGKAFVAALVLFVLGENVVSAGLVGQLEHTTWFGLHFYDCIWPSFMLMVGVSIPFSLAARSKTETYSQQLVHAIRRTIIIFLLGSVRESISLGSPFFIELSSALQPIAIAYFVSFLVVRRSWRFQASLAAAILASYGLVLAFVPAPGIPAGTYVLNHNLVHYVDMALLGPHYQIWPAFSEGWGTILVLIPPIATTLIGVIVGKLLMTSRSMGHKAAVIGAMGVGLLVLGLAVSPWMPIEMKMWTSSYGLASAGVACLEFLFFFWLVDMARVRKWGILFVPFGRNALFIYVATSIISFEAGTNIFTRPVAPHLGRGGPLLEAFAPIFVAWLILYWMMRRKVYVKV